MSYETLVKIREFLPDIQCCCLPDLITAILNFDKSSPCLELDFCITSTNSSNNMFRVGEYCFTKNEAEELVEYLDHLNRNISLMKLMIKNHKNKLPDELLNERKEV